MLTIYVLDKHGAPLLNAADGRRATISIGVPGTFQPLPEGPETSDSTWPPREASNSLEPTPEHLEALTDYVGGWDGVVFQGTPRGPEMECSRSLVIVLLRNAPEIRGQVEKAVENLNRRTFRC